MWRGNEFNDKWFSKILQFSFRLPRLSHKTLGRLVLSCPAQKLTPSTDWDDTWGHNCLSWLHHPSTPPQITPGHDMALLGFLLVKIFRQISGVRGWPGQARLALLKLPELRSGWGQSLVLSLTCDPTHHCIAGHKLPPAAATIPQLFIWNSLTLQTTLLQTLLHTIHVVTSNSLSLCADL